MSVIRLLDKDFTLFLTDKEIQAAVQLMANQINTDLNDEEVVFLGVMNGAFMFASDLLRRITFRSQVSFVKLTSYEGLSQTGKMKMLIGINEELKDKTVVIIEDIIDTGYTMKHMISQIKGFLPKRVCTVALLLKPDKLNVQIPLDYIGFRIPEDFLVGYGLDYNGYGRNLTSIFKLIR